MTRTIQHIEPTGLFVECEGGSLSIEESDKIGDVIRYGEDFLAVGWTSNPELNETIAWVGFQPDDSDRLAHIDTAIEALQTAREALKAAGYVDHAERRVSDRRRSQGGDTTSIATLSADFDMEPYAVAAALDLGHDYSDHAELDAATADEYRGILALMAEQAAATAV